MDRAGNRRILIADDNNDVARSLAMLLQLLESAALLGLLADTKP